MFSLLSCVETFKKIEIFVEQYCINCKGIEQKIYFGLSGWDLGYLEYWISGCILSIYGADHYFFGRWGMKIFPRQTIFFLYRCLWKHFFRCHLPARNFFHACKKFSWAFFAFANNFFRIPPPPPPPPSKSVRSSYGLQRTNLLTWIDELKP